MEELVEEERIYKVKGTRKELEPIEFLMGYINTLFAEGSSACVKIWCDGDGAAQVVFCHEDGKPIEIDWDPWESEFPKIPDRYDGKGKIGTID